MNEYLPTTPFDLYELHLLHLIAHHASFTAAARAAGLTQSAITRQVQGVEARLGVPLFERTTRRVAITPAGAFLLRETTRVVGDLDALLRRLREQFTDAPREVRIGVSRSISVSYFPGFFVAQRRRRPEIRLSIAHLPSHTLFAKLEANELDLAILSPPRRLPSTVQVMHRFLDAFDLILPPDVDPPAPSLRSKSVRWRQWLRQRSWLLINEDSHTGAALRAWLKKKGWPASDAAQMDSFDLIINLVALGQGVSLVPQRALALYAHTRRLQRFTVPDRFTRQLVVLTRKHPAPPAHVKAFVENILF